MQIELKDLIEKILGNITICLETNHDNEVFKNLDNYEEVLDFIIQELIYAARERNRYEASAVSCGNKAYNILKNIKEWIEEEE